MHTFFSKNKIVLILFACLLIPTAGFPVHVAFYLGKVDVVRNGKVVKVSVGTQLESGDVINTGSGGIAELKYSDGSKVKIHEKSSAKIGSLDVKQSDDVALISGNLTGKFSKLKKGSHSVYTPTIVCSIRGTEFQIRVSDSGESRVDLNQGNLDTSNPWGQSSMKAGQKIQAPIGGNPENASGSADAWQNNTNKQFNKNPWMASDDYKRYMKKMKARGDETTDEMNKFKPDKSKSKDQVQKDAWAIDNAQDKTKNDMMMNQCANDAISQIMNNFKNRKGQIYDEFNKIKQESNQVLDVQRKAYEDIQKVKEDYKKAYKEIMDDFNKTKGDIFKDLNHGKRPSMKDFNK